ncbi:MAG: hypothetical protein EOM91_10555 [Sphingobacteriia bacterium]|nr:hypothetical protein [Sphingobacteriia bacterium]NCC41089.1 hypothetical protein [Gammaproteobacteria bacterium]
MANEERIDEAIDRLERVILLLGERQDGLDRRIAALSTFALFDLFIVVLSISLLVVILSAHAPQLSAAVSNTNQYLRTMSDDMFNIQRSITRMREDVASLPEMVAQVDAIQGHVGAMGEHIGTMTGRVSAMNAHITGMSRQVNDLSLSFQVMDETIVRINQDVHHLSKPMRFFNQMNPFR